MLKKWGALIILTMATFIIVVDTTIMNVSVPALTEDINTTISGIKVQPGDWAIGDDDGMIIIPQESAVEFTNRAMDVLEKENRLRKEIKDGSSLSKVAELLKWEKK